MEVLGEGRRDGSGGGVGCPSGVDSGLWMPFSRPRGDGNEGQQRLEGR